MSETTQAINGSTMIEKFDPSKLMDGVKERIKATFVSLIPDEMWEKMLEKEIYVFTTGRIELKSKTDHNNKDENGNYVVNYWEEKTPYTMRPITDQWNHPTGKDDISPLQEMIREELRKKFREDLVNYLNGDQYTAIRDQYGITQISKAIDEIMVQHSSDLFRSIIGEFMQRGFENMRAQVAYNSGQY